MNRLAIFDLDGLLIDSEPWHCKSYQEVFQLVPKEFGLEPVYLSEKEYFKLWSSEGHSTEAAVDRYYPDLPIDIREALIARIRSQKMKIYSRFIKQGKIPLQEGVHNLLKSLLSKIDLVLASDSSRPSVDELVQKHNLEVYFNKNIYTKETVGTRKPNPYLFFYVADQKSVSDKECIVLEDAMKGLRAAKAANMKCIICPNEYTLPRFRNAKRYFKDADLVVKSLKLLNYDILKNLQYKK